jgi:hypothetical protein
MITPFLACYNPELPDQTGILSMRLMSKIRDSFKPVNTRPAVEITTTHGNATAA